MIKFGEKESHIKRLTDVCLDCGKDITDRMWNATKCIDCIEKTRVKNNRKQYYNMRDKKIDHIVAFTCVDCNDLVIVSNNSGISGYYCSKCKKIRDSINAKRHRLNTNSRLSAHRNKDFNKEEEIIIREIRRLKLRLWRRYNKPDIESIALNNK